MHLVGVCVCVLDLVAGVLNLLVCVCVGFAGVCGELIHSLFCRLSFKMGCCGVHAKKNLKSACCLPLALIALVFAAFEIGYPGWQNYEIVNSSTWPTGAAWMSVVLNAIHILIGVFAVIAVVCKWAPGVAGLCIGTHSPKRPPPYTHFYPSPLLNTHLLTPTPLSSLAAVVVVKYTCLVAAVRFVVCAYVFSLIALWVTWICQMNGRGTTDGKPWDPTQDDWIEMGALTGVMVIVLILAWYALSAFASLKMIFLAGGSGWEYKNYKQLSGAARDESTLDSTV